MSKHVEGRVAGSRIYIIDHDSTTVVAGRVLSLGESKYRVRWDDGRTTLEDRADYKRARVAKFQCSACGSGYDGYHVWGVRAACRDCGTPSVGITAFLDGVSRTSAEEGPGEFPVELVYSEGMGSEVKRKVFKNQGEVDKFFESKGGDISVVAWSADFDGKSEKESAAQKSDIPAVRAGDTITITVPPQTPSQAMQWQPSGWTPGYVPATTGGGTYYTSGSAGGATISFKVDRDE